MIGTSGMRRIGIGVALAGVLLAPMAMAAASAPEGDKGPGKGKLTAEQREKMKAMRVEHKKAMEPLHRRMKLQVDELRVLLDKDAGDAELGAKMKEIAKTRTAIRELEEKQMEEGEALVPVRMRAERLVKMHDRRMGQGRPGGEGPDRKPGMRRGQRGPGDGPDGPGRPGGPEGDDKD